MKKLFARTAAKVSFVLLILVMTLTSVVWAGKLIKETRTDFEAAIDATGKIWFYAQSIETHANRLLFAVSKEGYLASIERIRVLANFLEIQHLLLKRGTPDYGNKDGLTLTIQSIYHAPPLRMVEQVEQFLYQTRLLVQTPYEHFARNHPRRLYISRVVNGSLTKSLRDIMRSYKAESANGVNKVIFLLLAVLMLNGVGGFLGIIFLFSPTGREKITVKIRQSKSIANVLARMPLLQGFKPLSRTG